MRNGEENRIAHCPVCNKDTAQRKRWLLNIDGSETLVWWCTGCLFDMDTAYRYFKDGKYINPEQGRGD